MGMFEYFGLTQIVVLKFIKYLRAYPKSGDEIFKELV